jgi:hypothetical protein
MLIEVIFTGTIRSHRARFIAPRSTDDLMPWIVAEDLIQAAEMTRPARRSLLNGRGKFPGLMKAIELAGHGPAVVMGHQAVQGLMGALNDPRLHQEYTKAVMAAARVLYPDMFLDDGRGSFQINSTSIARLLGEDHATMAHRIETIEWPNDLGPPRPAG